MTEDQKRTLAMLLPSYAAKENLIVPRGKLPEQLHAEVESSENAKFLLAGQRGMGKTTELKRLVQLLQATQSLPVFVQFASQAEVSHDMLLEAMAAKLVASFGEEVPRRIRKIHQSFQSWFSEVEKSDDLEEASEGLVALGGQLPILKARTGIHRKQIKRTATRIKVKKDIGTLLDSFNDLVAETRKATLKRPVFIVDDIDKIQNLSSVENTFIHSCHLINSIDAPCIFTVPITYATSSLLRIASLPYSNIYRVPAVELVDEENVRNDNAFAFLRQVFALRMPFNPIPTELLEVILRYSGGVLVDAMRMVRGICKRCILDSRLEVSLATVEEEFQQLVDDYQFVFDSLVYWEKLAEFCSAANKAIIKTDDLLPELLYKMIVIEYREKKLWFDLHPAARRLYEQNSEIIDRITKR